MRHVISIAIFALAAIAAALLGGCKVHRQQIVETRYEQVHDTCYVRETVTEVVRDTCYLEREAAAVVTFAEGGGSYNHLTGEAVGVVSVTLTEKEAAQMFHVEHTEAVKDSTSGHTATDAETHSDTTKDTDGGRWWMWFCGGMLTAWAVGFALRLLINRIKIV